MKMEVITVPIRLSVVDDHPIVAKGIQLILKSARATSISITNHYINGTELRNDLSNLNSDVLLIDMCLPDIKGYELAKIVLDKYPDIKIGIYSNMLDREYILNAFKNGVLGYLPKSANSEEIVDFIETISRGERYVRGDVANVIFENNHFFNKQQKLNITKRELEILQMILDGYKNKQIAKNLSIALRTVEFHKQNLFIKLDVNNTIELYKAALRLNLLSPEEAVR